MKLSEKIPQIIERKPHFWCEISSPVILSQNCNSNGGDENLWAEQEFLGGNWVSLAELGRI